MYVGSFSISGALCCPAGRSAVMLFDKNKIEHCNFLKLDCEGSEYEIIRHLPSEYFQKIDKMIIEYHMADTHPELLDELMQILKSHNYEFKIKTLFNDIGFLYAIRSDS